MMPYALVAKKQGQTAEEKRQARDGGTVF